jgi:hypothetical protein
MVDDAWNCATSAWNSSNLIPSPFTTTANGTGVAVGGTGVLVGSGVLSDVGVISTTIPVPVGTGLVELHAENTKGKKQKTTMKTKSWRRLIGQIIPVNRFPANRMEINDAYLVRTYTFLCRKVDVFPVHDTVQIELRSNPIVKLCYYA